MTETEARIEKHVLSTYPGVVADLEAAAIAASDDWPDAGTSDASRVRASFRSALANGAVCEKLHGVLASAVQTAGRTLQTQPVPAPPYVVVTSLGLVLRATLADCRLVVELEVFEQQDGHYHRRDSVAVTARLV